MCGTQSGPIRFSPGKKPKNPWETPSGRHHGNVAAGRDLSFEGGKIRRANFVCPASLFLPSAGRADTPLRPPRWCIGSRSPTDRTMASEAVGPGSIPGGTTTSRRKKRRASSMEQRARAAGGPRAAPLQPFSARVSCLIARLLYFPLQPPPRALMRRTVAMNRWAEIWAFWRSSCRRVRSASR